MPFEPLKKGFEAKLIPEKKEPLAKRAVETVGRMFTPLGETLGIAAAVPGINIQQKEIIEREQELHRNLMSMFRKETDPEKKRKILDLMKNQETTILQEKVPGMDKTTSQIVGEAMITGMTTIAPLLPTGVGLLPRVGVGAAVGGVYGAGRALAVGEEMPVEIAKKAGIGAAIGGVVAGSLYGIQKGIQAIGKKIIPKTYAQLLRPRMKKEIYFGKPTMPERIVKEGYKGTLNQMRSQAERNQEVIGKQIDKTLLGKVDKEIFKTNIQTRMADFLDDPITMEGHEKAVEKAFARISDRMTPTEANALKQFYTDKVPRGFWKSTDSKISFTGEFYERLSRAFRREIEKVVPEIRDINSKWAIARGVRELASIALEKSAKQKLNTFNFVTMFYEKTLGSAWISTNIAQALDTAIKILQSKTNQAATLLLLRPIIEGIGAITPEAPPTEEPSIARETIEEMGRIVLPKPSPLGEKLGEQFGKPEPPIVKETIKEAGRIITPRPSPLGVKLGEQFLGK